MPIPPMTYFKPSFKTVQRRSDIALAQLNQSDAVTQDIYDHFFHEKRLAHKMFVYNDKERDVVALQMGVWAARNLFNERIYSKRALGRLIPLSPTDRARHIFASLYDVLLLSLFHIPRGWEDRLCRAILNCSGHLEHDQGAAGEIIRTEEAITQYHQGGNPHKAYDVHELIFADCAVFHFADVGGYLVFKGRKDSNAATPAFYAAFKKLLAALNLISCVDLFIKRHDLEAEQFIDALTQKITAQHKQNPFGLMRGRQISAFRGELRALMNTCLSAPCDTAPSLSNNGEV